MKKIRATIRKQLGYVIRDLGYIEKYLEEGYALASKFINNYQRNIESSIISNWKPHDDAG